MDDLRTIFGAKLGIHKRHLKACIGMNLGRLIINRRRNILVEAYI